MCEKEKKKRVKRSSDGRRFGEGESEDGRWSNGEIVDSDVKRNILKKYLTSLAIRCDVSYLDNCADVFACLRPFFSFTQSI